MITVESSNLKEIGYDSESSTLFITFKAKGKGSESTYKYYPVTQGLYLELLTASSKGEYFAHNIKSNTSIVGEKVI